MKKKAVVKKTEAKKPKYVVGASIFFIKKHDGKAVQGKIETRTTVATPVKAENSNRVIGEEEQYFYEVRSAYGVVTLHESELYPDFKTVAATFTRQHLVLLN